MRTDAAGRYSLSLEPGTYVIRYAPTSNAYQSQYWNGRFSHLTAHYIVVGDAPITGMDATLPTYGSISGTAFLGGSDKRAEAGQVRATAYRCYEDGCVSGGEPSTVTDASGSYSFTRLGNGVYTIRFAYLAGPEFQAPHRPSSSRWTTLRQVFTGQDVTMPPTSSISGSVFLGSDGTRAGADEVIVTAKPTNSSQGYAANTDGAGHYTLSGLPSGYYDLVFDYVGAGGFADQVWPNSPARSWTRRPSQSARSRWCGISRSRAGRRSVAPCATSPMRPSRAWRSSRRPSIPAATDPRSRCNVRVSGADGRYAFDALPPAHYKVQFLGTGGVFRDDPHRPCGQGRRRADRFRRDDVPIDQVLLRSVICARCGEYQVAQSLIVKLERNVGTRAEPAWVEAASNIVWGSEGGGDRASYIFTNLNGLRAGTYRARVIGDWDWRTLGPTRWPPSPSTMART